MLQKLGFLPGFNKQVTSTGAESQWTGGENVRFRYDGGGFQQRVSLASAEPSPVYEGCFASYRCSFSFL